MLFTPAGEIHLGKIFSKCVVFVENPYLAVVDDISFCIVLWFYL